MTTARLSPAEVYRLVGDRIRHERSRRKLSQQELALRIGLTRTSITNIEKGRQKVLLHTMFEIARALEIPMNEILAPLESALVQSFDDQLPENLSTDIKDWIVSGVRLAQKSEKS